MLDIFGGAGSTLLAAELCGRKARLLEIDPLYCDTIIRRFEAQTGAKACLEETGQTFAECADACSEPGVEATV